MALGRRRVGRSRRRAGGYPHVARMSAGVTQLVECQPSKLNVEGSNPFTRFEQRGVCRTPSRNPPHADGPAFRCRRLDRWAWGRDATGMLRKVALLVVLALPTLAACTNRQQAYPDVPPEQLWTAMKAAAREPTYRDWFVLENSVAVDEADEADRFFADVQALLDGAPFGARTAAPSTVVTPSAGLPGPVSPTSPSSRSSAATARGPDIWAPPFASSTPPSREGLRRLPQRHLLDGGPLAGEKSFKKFNLAARRHRRRLQAVPGRHQGPAHHPGRRWHPLPQCRPPADARPLRLPAAGPILRRRPQPGEAPRGGRDGDLPREHRGHLRRHRIRRRLAESQKVLDFLAKEFPKDFKKIRFGTREAGDAWQRRWKAVGAPKHGRPREGRHRLQAGQLVRHASASSTAPSATPSSSTANPSRSSTRGTS
jgi:hypothetical protein